jgi:hypothetical protein
MSTVKLLAGGCPLHRRHAAAAASCRDDDVVAASCLEDGGEAIGDHCLTDGVIGAVFAGDWISWELEGCRPGR